MDLQKWALIVNMLSVVVQNKEYTSFLLNCSTRWGGDLLSIFYNFQLDIAQRRVDQAKLTMNEGATSKDFANTLATARGKRDILMTKKHQLLEWREMLAIQKKNLKVTDVNGPLDPVFLQYMEIYERFQAERQASKEFCDKKVWFFIHICQTFFLLPPWWR